MDRIPETWKPYFALAVGDPEKDADFLTERSPKTHISDISCPLLVIQGQNDPRVPASDTAKLVAATKDRIPVWYVLAKNEGHGFVQLSNRNYRLYATILFVKEFLLK